MNKPIQYFTKEYLERCKGFSTAQVLEFLDNWQRMIAKSPEKCRLISLKIEPSLLETFKQKAALEGIGYQTKIKQLMRNWLEKPLKKSSKRASRHKGHGREDPLSRAL
jgi:uncharacterized protein (DUF4415 family)